MQLSVPEQSDDCGRWVVSDGSRDLLHATVDQLPDASLALLDIEQQPGLTAVVAADAATLLLNRAIALGQERQLRFLRFLNWHSVSPLPETVLNETGFDAATHIHQWACSAKVRAQRPTGTATIRRLRLNPAAGKSAATAMIVHAALSVADYQQLIKLVNACLRDSGDLTSLPTADPNCLVRTWQSLDGTVDLLLAESGGQDVGIAVVSSGGPGETSTLEYLAIVPEHRRRGHAAQLLAQVCEHLSRSASVLPSDEQTGQAGRNPSLVTYCDEQNHAAAALYQKNSFVCVQRATLWIRRI